MKKITYQTSLIIVTILMSPIAAWSCTECHSKNPKMVSMHKALEYKDCFKCHGPASDRKAPKSKDEMTIDPLCVSCHKKETSQQKQP